ncbi:hypothetical protein F6V25_14420 [Oryzomonas japonica]|uniref:Uncharacterized protein n=1 Tax=Oryzomonas japonica TaxID=2603858 RepID=A0A7J4ZMP1_9BACT|nr:hypothetical protein [Oryzomonas japonica]KAB0664005.1 hypothetical protein F6V25_14420 [Oryzomonas japonica]
MSIPIQNFSGSEPNVAECRTEYLVDEFSRCLAHNTACRYAVPAGNTSSYCIHPNHTAFQDMPAFGDRQDHGASGHNHSMAH